MGNSAMLAKLMHDEERKKSPPTRSEIEQSKQIGALPMLKNASNERSP